jgi:hypothetical protein
METVEKSKSKSGFSTVSTALGNPPKGAGFPHSHSDGGGLTSIKTTPWLVARFLFPEATRPPALNRYVRNTKTHTLKNIVTA